MPEYFNARTWSSLGFNLEQIRFLQNVTDKLNGVEAGATADQTTSEIETAYNTAVSVVTQAIAEAGVSTTTYRWTAERVAQAVAAIGGGLFAPIANSHARSHAITSASDHTAGNWKVVYTNGSGAVVELALPALGFLKGVGASSAPIFAMPQFVISLSGHAGANVILTNQAAGEDFFDTNERNIYKADLTGYSQVRLTANVRVGGHTTAIILLEYHTSYSTTVGDYSTIGSTSVQCSIASAGMADSGWIDLVSGAKADVFLALLQSGGDGVADPSFGHIWAHFR